MGELRDNYPKERKKMGFYILCLKVHAKSHFILVYIDIRYLIRLLGLSDIFLLKT